jgi:cold shock CspA family protein
VASQGTIIRYDEVRGYGFIAPAGGGEDVFVHANDFGDGRHLVHPGLAVEFEAEQGDRGLKAAAVRILDKQPEPAAGKAERFARERSGTGEDDGMCDVLASRVFLAKVTETLIEHVPTLTGAQIAQIRARMEDLARTHGWVES